LTEHYEQVRAAVLARNGGVGPRWGQAVLLSRGIVAWMQAMGPALGSLRPLAVAPAAAAEALPALVRQDLIGLMGEIVLNLARKNQTS
jgi:hypothetical protein